MNVCNPPNVRSFLVDLYRDRLAAAGYAPEALGDDFDFLGTGIIDSLGVLELISAVEEEFKVTIDLADLDAEKLTLIGPLSEHIGRTALAAERPEVG